MTNKVQNSNVKKQYDLKERTARFGENVIDFVQSLEITPVTRPLISQVVRASTSIGANYIEADAATSKKEAKETVHWLRMILKITIYKRDACTLLSKEAQELSLIFSAIFNKSKPK